MQEELILGLCASTNGATLEDLRLKCPDVSEKNLVDILNNLLQAEKLSVAKRGSTLYYYCDTYDPTLESFSITEDEKILYQSIKFAGNQGIWTKDLKIRTNLHQTIISKSLKTLETKKLIKAVKSVKNSPRKLYMLYNLEPSSEITGGPWFTDFELDSQFVEDLVDSVLKIINSKMNLNIKETIFPVDFTYPTIKDIAFSLSSLRITNADLSHDNIRQIVERLYFDGSIALDYVRLRDDDVLQSCDAASNDLNFFGVHFGSYTH